MKDILSQLETIKIIPVVKIDDAKRAVGLANALIGGGIDCVEITFRTDAAEEAIKSINSVKGMLLGAGTVLSAEQARKAMNAGAKFIVTPGVNPPVIKYCLDNKITIIPGVSTPTEIETALGFGLKVLKFFPAEAFGGVKTLSAISAPYKGIRFIPTGGINDKNIIEYLKLPQVIACGGTWMVKEELINLGNFKEITALARKAVESVSKLSC